MPSGKDISDEQKCHSYAHFMRNLSHHHASVVFWSLFALVLVLMCATSISYGSSHDCQTYECRKKGRKCRNAMRVKSRSDRNLNPAQREEAENLRRISCMNRCLVCSFLFASIGTVAMVFGALAGVNLFYCHAESLMFVIWAMWGVLQIGSTLAMWGVFVHQWRARVSPNIKAPWNIALGTPVLVIAGGAHWIYEEALAFITRKRREEDDEEDVEEDDDTELLETPDLGVQFMYTKKPTGPIPLGATLTHCRNGRYKVFIPQPSFDMWMAEHGNDSGVVSKPGWVVRRGGEEQDGVAFSRAVTVRVEDEGGITPPPRALVAESIPRALVRTRSV